ncbi:MAG: cytochrome c biogenesis protein ResB [Actinobacteria bacterium]|nr:cytochrome c biogenesis protein ResB [Actinomycetota bacterium]
MNVRRSLGLVWRSLRSMRTALALLLLLGLFSVAGSLVPQVGVADARIAQMFREHPLRAEIYENFGLFDVFGSWWFTLVYALLLLSLFACLFPRTRGLYRNLRARPEPLRELDGLRHHAVRDVAGEPDRVLAGARRVLRRRWFRVRGPGDDGAATLSAEKGLAREAGSLLFHWSFFLILVGIVWGKGTGFTGQAAIVEGETWTEAHVNYDGLIREGRFFGEDHSGIRVRVRDFTVVYRPDTTPARFTTAALLYDAGGRFVGSVDIEVNRPASIGGVKLFQFGFGWAPVVEVRKDGELIASGPVAFRQSTAPGTDPRTLPWQGVVKLPSLRPQVGIELDLWPDRRALVAFLTTGQRLPMLEDHEPVLSFTAFRGDLRLDSPQRTSDLDHTELTEWTSDAVGIGETIDIGEGITVSFPELRQYTVLQVTRDRGLWIMLVAAILILVGLMPALYGSRRRLWVRAERDGAGTRLEVGGFALQRKAQFEEEFSSLVAELERVGTR